MALPSIITPDRLRGPYGMPRIKPRSVKCKTNAQSTGYCSTPCLFVYLFLSLEEHLLVLGGYSPLCLEITPGNDQGSLPVVFMGPYVVPGIKPRLPECKTSISTSILSL